MLFNRTRGFHPSTETRQLQWTAAAAAVDDGDDCILQVCGGVRTNKHDAPHPTTPPLGQWREGLDQRCKRTCLPVPGLYLHWLVRAGRHR